jgi:hypothetical protein
VVSCSDGGGMGWLAGLVGWLACWLGRDRTGKPGGSTAQSQIRGEPRLRRLSHAHSNLKAHPIIHAAAGDGLWSLVFPCVARTLSIGVAAR